MFSLCKSGTFESSGYLPFMRIWCYAHVTRETPFAERGCSRLGDIWRRAMRESLSAVQKNGRPPPVVQGSRREIVSLLIVAGEKRGDGGGGRQVVHKSFREVLSLPYPWRGSQPLSFAGECTCWHEAVSLPCPR